MGWPSRSRSSMPSRRRSAHAWCAFWNRCRATSCSTADGSSSRTQGRDSARVRDFALYGETTGETDQYGLPVRLDWAASYHGARFVAYGHTPVLEPRWMHETVNIDTGCVFGGRLTALRWPERELVSVPAQREYARSSRPFLPHHFAQDAAPG